VFGFQPVVQLGEHRIAAGHVGAMHLIRPQRTGIVDVDIDAVRRERAECERRSEIALLAAGHTGVRQSIGDDISEDVLLGEILSADDVRLRARGVQRNQTCRNDNDQPDRRGDDAFGCPARQSGCRQRKQLIEHQRQQRRANAAEQNENPVLRLQTGEDVIAETRLSDRRGECCRADDPHRRRTNARNDHRCGQRQLDQTQRLTRRHAHAFRRHQNGWIDFHKGGDRVAQHGQH